MIVIQKLVGSGIHGLDVILDGGIPEGNGVIIEGAPGTGKTTIGIQFLHHGVSIGEAGLYITFEELPEQIYSDMSSFGWDIKQLDENGKLKVISISPEVLVEAMLEPGGFFEETIKSMNCKRIVIDSLSLYRYFETDEAKKRRLMYSLRNILRKHKLTSLIITEQFGPKKNAPYEQFIFDGVIQLDFSEKFDEYKERTLEVLKMRGTKIIEGKHTYRFTSNGIYILPAYLSNRKELQKDNSKISTGIDMLDHILNGGISKGSLNLIATDSRAMYKCIMASITSQRIKAEEKFLYLPSSKTTIEELLKIFSLYNIDLEERALNNGGIFLEQYHRSIPSRIKSSVYNVSKMTNEEYWSFISEDLVHTLKIDINKGKSWFLYYDINSAIDKRGKEFINNIFGELVAIEKALGLTVFVLCNYEKVDADTLALLEYNSDCVIKTWMNNKYQYLQINKSPVGTISSPYIVENITALPFFRLL